MDFNSIFAFLSPLILIFVGIMAKYSNNDGYSKLKNYWLYFVIVGSLLLILKVLKYWFL